MGANDEWLESLDDEEIRILTWNGNRVQAFQNALAQLKSRAETIPDLASEIIHEECWLKWLDSKGKSFTHSKAEFRRFVEADRPDGCQTPLHVLLKTVEGTPAFQAVNDALRGEQGAVLGNDHAPKRDGMTGKYTCTTNRNNVTDSGPSIISLPIPESEPPVRKRNYSRESKQGNSVSYGIRRLQKAAEKGKIDPSVYERVKAGELTVNKGLTSTGLKLREITVPDDPVKAFRRLVLHFKDDRLETLIRELANWAGFDIVRKT
jgi:hypothetical protein